MIEDINIIAKYVHGSGDSVDTDIIYVLDKAPDFRKCKQICDELEGNANIMTINDGIVDWCYKGSVDEVNNSVLATYGLHEQTDELLITRKVGRDVGLKVIRSIRGLLCHISRSQYRPEIKEALRSGWDKKMQVFRNIRLVKIDNWDELQNNMSGADIKKFIAFQIGQTLALFDGEELYTKADIANKYSMLRPYLYREEDADICNLSFFWDILGRVFKEYPCLVHNDYIYWGNSYYDTRNECVYDGFYKPFTPKN